VDVKFWKLTLAIGITALPGCALSGTRVTDANNSFRTNHYEWVVPPERGWNLKESREPFVLTDRVRSIAHTKDYRIVVLENTIAGERLRGQTAKFIADDYRRSEESIMIERGVKTGEYGLSPVELGEVEVGSKTFWTMKYKTFHEDLTTHATLYLYLPRMADNEHFLLILYSATVYSDSVPDSEHEGDLLRVLESLKAR
jgi:hypothetical protein